MDEDINNLLDKWYEAKQEISSLEKKIEKYKLYVEDIMNKRNIDVLSSYKITVQRKEQNRTTISKKDLPSDIWDRYCKELFYNVFYISKKNNKIRKSKKISKRL
jgi:hypothetical protein